MTGVFHAWLVSILFWLGLSLGSMALLMIYHLVGGRWGMATCRILEAAMAPLPWMALLFLPLFFGLQRLYPWANEAVVAADPILRHRQPWMNEPAFIFRNLIYFGIWIGMAIPLRRWSLRCDDPDKSDIPMRRLRRLSGGGLVVFAITTTLAFLDWVMSLEPHWYSTIFMVLQAIGMMLTAHCLAVLVFSQLCKMPPLAQFATPIVNRQLGNLLLAFVMLWTYLAVSQLIIIWMGNLPQEISWYLHRIEGVWAWIIGVIAVLHFAAPFFILLSREAKQRSAVLSGLAVTILFSHLLYDTWLVIPAEEGLFGAWLAPLTSIFVGVVWYKYFQIALRRAPLVPSTPSGFRG
jgi:hypothetical protein